MRFICTMLLVLAPSLVRAQEHDWELGLYHEHTFRLQRAEVQIARGSDYAQLRSTITPRNGYFGLISVDSAAGKTLGRVSAVVGVYQDFGKVFRAGAAAGFQSQAIGLGNQAGGRTDLRFATMLRLGPRDECNPFADFYYESGNGHALTNWYKKFNVGWYQANVAYQCTGLLVGFFSQTGLGHGVRIRGTRPVKYWSDNLDYRIWGGPMVKQAEEGQWHKYAVLGFDLVAHSKKVN